MLLPVRDSASVAIAGTTARVEIRHSTSLRPTSRAMPARRGTGAESRATLAVAPRVSFCPERGSVSCRHELAMTRQLARRGAVL